MRLILSKVVAIEIIKSMANISLFILFIAMVIERIIPGNKFTFILIVLAGLISITGFIFLLFKDTLKNGLKLEIYIG